MKLKVRSKNTSESDVIGGCNVEVWIDGEQQMDITNLWIACDATGIATATMTRVVIGELDIEGDFTLGSVTK